MTPRSLAPRLSRSHRVRLRRWWVNLPIRFKGLMVVALPLLTLALAMLIRNPFSRQQQETAAVLAHAADTRDMAQDLLVSLLDVDAGAGAVTNGRRCVGDVVVL